MYRDLIPTTQSRLRRRCTRPRSTNIRTAAEPPRSDPDQPPGPFQHSVCCISPLFGRPLCSAQVATSHHASDPRANALVLRQGRCNMPSTSPRFALHAKLYHLPDVIRRRRREPSNNMVRDWICSGCTRDGPCNWTHGTASKSFALPLQG